MYFIVILPTIIKKSANECLERSFIYQIKMFDTSSCFGIKFHYCGQFDTFFVIVLINFDMVLSPLVIRFQLTGYFH